MAKKAKRNNVNVAEAVAWAAENYEKVIHEDNGRQQLLWNKAATPPPSDLARSYMRFASANPSHFFSRTVPQFLGEDEVVSEEAVARDKKLIAAVRTVLRGFTTDFGGVDVPKRKPLCRKKEAAESEAEETEVGEV